MLLMAPRRNNNAISNSIVHQQQHHQHQQQQQQQQHAQQQQTLLLASAFFSDENFSETPASAISAATISNSSNNNGNINSATNTNNNNNLINPNSNNNIGNTMSPMQTSNGVGNTNGNAGQESQFTRCCFPNGDCFKLDPLISVDNVSDCVRVICNNENCNVGQFMHRECFESWEQTVLVTLKSIGRARSWSERQRSQNLWTKKGYDLVYKACGCKCGRGHIRKDLEWSASNGSSSQLAKSNGSVVVNGHGYVNNGGSSANGQQQQRIGNGGVNCHNNSNSHNNTNSDDVEASKKKKKRNRNNQKPTLALAPLNPNGYHPNSQQQQQQQQPQQQQQQNGLNGSAAVANGNGSSSNNNTNGNNSANNNGNGQLSNGNSNNLSPNPNVGVIGSGLHSHSQAQQQQQTQQQQGINNTLGQNVVGLTNGHGNVLGLDLRARAGSLSSSGSGSTSPSASHSSDISISPIHHSQQQQQQQLQLQQQQQYQQTLLQNGLTKSILNGINGCLGAAPNSNGGGQLLVTKSQQQQQILGNGLNHLSPIDQQQLVQQQKNKEVEIYSERVRSTSGCNGIFSRRLDFSSFNLLPKTRLNSYQVKIEDEGNHGNDETRLFILSSLAQSQMSRVACILCEEPMLVFDRYPLVDGSFFLSPKQHSPGCIEVKYEGRALYLTCVCMGCLDGTSSNRVISCRFCGDIWDGSNLVLGTMYAYDIFAAMPCCAERLKCNNCFKLLLHPQQRLNFYSDYSHCVTCPYCATQDTHFVKPLSYCYTKSGVGRHQLIA